MSELQEFVEHIQAWHVNATRQLQTIVDVPGTTEIRLGTDDDATVLTGEQAKGFRSGVIVALQFLGKLPFSVNTDGPSNDACDLCGQEDTGQTGEHPCDACGVPTEHDAAVDDLAGRNLGMVEGLQVIDTATGLPKA